MNKLKIGQQINKQDTICNEINLYFYIIERAGIVILTNFDECVACGCVCVVAARSWRSRTACSSTLGE